MAVTPQSIINRAKTTLLDETNVRWTDDELLKYLNDGQREIVMFKPSSFTKNESVQLEAGSKQAIPTGGIEFVEAVRNMGTTGDTPGRAITPARRRDLDVTRPDWHGDGNQDVEVKHTLYDSRNPKNYYVTPPNSGNGYIEILYSASPDEVVLADSDITLDDIYQTPLFYYTLFRAHSKETESASPDRAASYYKLFAQAIAEQTKSEAQT